MLYIKDLLSLYKNDFEFIAGEGGLEKKIYSAGILDYEFAKDISYYNETPFEKDSLVISSLLFAQNDSSLILPAIKKLYDYGVSGFAYKSIIYDKLPNDVLEFANKNDFSIFRISLNIYFEEIIYTIMSTITHNDLTMLSEETIEKMLSNKLSNYDVNKISNGISLHFRQYALSYYIGFPSKSDIDFARLTRALYLNKKLKQKGSIFKFRNGFFLLLTSDSDEIKTFEIIKKEFLSIIPIDLKSTLICGSNAHRPHNNLDCCFRESYHTYIASLLEAEPYVSYSDIWIYKWLIPMKNSLSMENLATNPIKNIFQDDELLSTAIAYLDCHGDINLTSQSCNLHSNTIRYRLTKIKKAIKAEKRTDFEFYVELCVLVRLYQINQLY